MAVGDIGRKSATDPIVQAIALAEAGTSGEIRVHVTKRLWEKDPFGRALHLFERFGMARTRQRNGILLYVNLRRHRFAIVADQALDRAVGPAYWQEIAHQLIEDLRATDPERAIGMAITRIGEKLSWHFPAENPETATTESAGTHSSHPAALLQSKKKAQEKAKDKRK